MDKEDKMIVALRIELLNAKAQAEIQTLWRDMLEKVATLQEEVIEKEHTILQEENETLKQILEDCKE